MLDFMFNSVFGSTDSLVSDVSAGSFLLCCVVSLALGLACALIYMYKHNYSKNFVVTLALLPLIVQMVIVLVNGNLGAGIAVMGVFNLVRFRSIPGSAKDIGSVFFAMAIGLATGMGFLGLAVVFTVILGIANIIYVSSPFAKQAVCGKTLKIQVPEDLNFEGIFEPVLEKYSKRYELVEVRTTNMGSLYNLTYEVVVTEEASVKDLIDELRCLNGNLKISLCRLETARETL